MTHTKPYLLGITGGSASGKTFLLTQLLEQYEETQITLVSQDNYYRPKSELPLDAEGHVNYDHPEALDLDAFARDLESLSRGESITFQEYTFNNPDIKPRTITIHPTPVIVVEGLFVFYHPGVSRQLDLKIFVDAEEHIRLSRRIRRDIEERAWKMEAILQYYQKYVIPMYKKYIRPFKDECDLILPNNFHMDNAIKVIISHLNTLIFPEK